MDSFITNISSYKENHIFLSRTYKTKNDFFKQYSNAYSEKEKCSQLFIQVLYELKTAICEGNFKNFKNLSNTFSYIKECEKFAELAFHFCEDSNHPFKGTNIIILACKYNRLEILKEICLNYSKIYEDLFKNEENILLPSDKDENLHNAFYYSIRADNVELIETLIKKWPGNYFETHSDELDVILSEAYEELKLNNVLLSDATEIFIEKELINLRFFSSKTKSIRGDKFFLPMKSRERIDLLIEQINSFKEVSEVNDEKFLLILKYIIQNINTLKRLLKKTYSKIPWEEMEFCLVSFLLSCTQQKEIVLFYRAVLSKKRILNHLTNFVRGLEIIKEEMQPYQRCGFSALPKLSRRLNTLQIIKCNPGYEALYSDYQKISDIHSLNTISTYITLATSANVKEKEGQLIISRSLQVIGECMKSTLQSPKLSPQTSDLLLLSLPKNTREVVIDLRNSLSHVHSLSNRIEIELNAKNNASFFQGVQNDIKKIGHVINDILFESRLQSLKIILETIVNSNDSKEVEEIIAIFNIEKLMPQNFCLPEDTKLRDVIDKLKDAIPNITAEEVDIFQKMYEIVNLQNNKLADKMEKYSCRVSDLSYFTKALNGHINEQIYKSIKYVCKNALANIAETAVKPHSMKCLATLAISLFMINEQKLETTVGELKRLEAFKYLEVIKMFVLEIMSIAEIQIEKVEWVDDLREKLNKKKFTDEYRVKHVINKVEYTKQLTFKISELKNTLQSHKLDDPSHIPVGFKNGKTIAAIEMLILDILSVLGQLDKGLEDGHFFLDQNIPFLIGKNLRNHLAHYNTVTEVLPSDPARVLILNVQIIAEKLEVNSTKIGKYIEEDVTKLKNKISTELNFITLKQKMFDALEIGDFEMLKSCIAQGADIHSRKRDNWTTLHAAAKGGNLNVVKFLIEQKVQINIKSVNQQNPLHVAAAFGNPNVVEYFIEQKYYNLEAVDDTRKTPLHLATLNKHTSIIEMLLKRNANRLAKDSSGESPVHYAVQQNHLDAVQVLLMNENRVDDNEMLGGFTPLHLAADAGSLDVVQFLVNRGANVNATNDMKALPLHLAATNGHTEVVKVLLRNNSEINVTTWDGCTPLYFATESGHKEIVDILLKNGANPNIFDRTYKYGPIHLTAVIGHVEILKALLRHNANDNVITNHGKSPFDYAVEFGKLEIVKILHEHGVSVKGQKDNPALHTAVKFGHLDIVEYLIDQKVNVNVADKNRMTPLHYAAHEGRDDIVSLLIKKNAKVNARNSDNGFTPLLEVLGKCIQGIDQLPYHVQRILRPIFRFKIIDDKEKYSSLRHKYEKIVDILLKNGADVNAKTTTGTTVLHFAAASGIYSIVKMLLQRNVPVNQLCNQQFTPLHSAIIFGHKQIVELLLENKAKINFEDPLKYSALHTAVECGHKNIVKLLLANKANVNEKSCESRSPARVTLYENRAEILELLIENGADVHENKEDNLKLSIIKESNDVFKLFLKHTSIKNNPELSGNLLDMAIARNNVDAVNAMIAHGVNVNRGDIDNSPLPNAVGRKHFKIVEILLKNGADVNGIMEPKGLSALHVAATIGNVEIAEILLKHGADINIRNKDNSTALHLAIAAGSYRMVKLLFPLLKVDINEKGIDGFTLLHIAARSGSMEVVKFLIEKGADPHIKTDTGEKPVHTATHEGHLEVLKYFVDQGTDIDWDLGSHAWTVFHYAAWKNRVEIAQYLIQKGADINAMDTSGGVPLHLAVQFASAEFITNMLENGAMYNFANVSNGVTPMQICKNIEMLEILVLIDNLFKAVAENDSYRVEGYIECGALVNVRNAENLTPLHTAAREGLDKIVQILLKNKADPNAVGKGGFTPLHYAAMFGHLRVCKTLLQAGAIYNAVDENGKTPLDLSKKKDVAELLKYIHSYFEEVSSKNTKVIADLKKLKDEHMVKAALRARNEEGKTLVATAILHEFPKVDELKEILQTYLRSAIQLAEALCTREKYDDALMIYSMTCEARAEILGKDDLGTLDIRSKIAAVLYNQHKYNEAFKIHNEIYEQYRILLGENSKEALETKCSLAEILYRLGKREEALVMYEEIYAAQTRILSVNDEDLLKTLLGKASVLFTLNTVQGNEESLKIYRHACRYKKKKIGVSRAEILYIKNCIGMTLKNLGRHEEALETLRKVYEGRKKVLGLYHSHTLRTSFNIILVLEALNRETEALEEYNNLLKTQEVHLGRDHLDTLTTQFHMGMLFCRQGKFHNAMNTINKSLPGLRLKLGSNHPKVVQAESIVEKIRKAFEQSGFLDTLAAMNSITSAAVEAAKIGNVQKLKILIQNGLEVNELDDEGRSPLHYACNFGHADVALLLLASGASPTKASSNGKTPLHFAAMKGREELVKLLLGGVERGALLQYVNAEISGSGNTALHLAAKDGQHGVVRMLLAQGACFEATNHKGKTPLQLTKNYRVSELLQSVASMFEYVRTGNEEVVRIMRKATKEQVFVFANVRNLQGATLSVVAASHEHRQLAGEVLAAAKRFS